MAQVQPAAASTNFETIFTAALEAYTKQTKKNITSHPLATQLQSCDSPSAIIAMLRTQVDQSQSGDEKWTKWLDPTVNVLYAFSLTLGNGAALVFPAANAIFAGIGVLLQAIKDVRAGQETLADLFGRLEFFFKRLEKYIDVRPSASMTDIIVKIMVEVISILGLVTKEVMQGRTKRYLKRLIGRNDVEEALQRLDKLTQEEVRMAATEVLTITRGIDDKVRTVDSKVQGVDVAIRQVVDQVSAINRNELRKEHRKWIAPPDPSINYNVASGAHHAGTAAWCTEGTTFADWKTSGSLLWIHGKPGSGKSILSSVIIRDIESLADIGSACMAYFFFDFKDTGKQDSRALLSSLLIQLSDQSDQCCDVLIGLHSAHRNGSRQPTEDSLSQCLEDMLTAMGQVPIYLIVDALDECPTGSGVPSLREKVLKLVKELVGLNLPYLRLCLTSRPEFDIRTALKPLATQQLSLHDESRQKRDIVDYVTSIVRSDDRMKRWREDDKNIVIEKLTAKADGMFRWVFCQLEVLRHCFPTNLRRTLEELPKSLDGTYKRILNEINNANRDHAYRLLQCLTVALRPLRVEELAGVLAIDLNMGGLPKLDPDWHWEDQEEAVLSACSSLVSVTVSHGARVVQFSHFSVKEFLTSDRLASCTEEVSRFYIPIEPSHAIFAQACLGVLLRLEDYTDRDSARNTLLLYGAVYWVEHAQVGNVELQIKDAVDHFLDMDKPYFSAWIDQLSRLTSRSWHIVGLLSRSPLHFAAGRGLRGFVERQIIKHPEQVNHLGGRNGTPLHASALTGKIEVARLLLAHAADINSRTASNSTPLHFALQKGHPEIGKWLIDHGADVNIRQDNGRSPLHFAASKGHFEVTQILLQHNAEVNSRDIQGITPFFGASERGNPDVVRLLLDHNAEVHVSDKQGVTPLHKAAVKGHLEVARILLECKVEVNACDDEGATPLLRALENGDPDVVRLLLENDADPHVYNNVGVTPLHIAVIKGNLKVSRMLLERKVEVNSRDHQGATPFLIASKLGNPDLVRLLLDHDADAHVSDNRVVTPLHNAAINGNLEVFRILLEKNAEVNALDDGEATPIFRALESRNLEVVRLLLDHDADVHIRNNKGVTLLHKAASGGHLEVARMLLERKAEVNTQDDDGSTPLHEATRERIPFPDLSKVVRLLLDNNANADVRDNKGVTPLHMAAALGRLDVVQMLLEQTVNVNAQDNHGFTPLYRATGEHSRELPEVVRLLLDHNADIHVRSNEGVTPLHNAAAYGHLEVSRMLIEQKAEVNAQDDNGSTPLHKAARTAQIYWAHFPEVVRLLLDHNADVHLRDNKGATPLHNAIAEGHLEVARMLLQREAEVNVRDNGGLTPLHKASRPPHWLRVFPGVFPEAVRLLLDYNADANARDNSGTTPLHGAVYGGHLEVARILLEKNAEVNAKDDNGDTPLHCAAHCGHLNVVRLLLEKNVAVNSPNNEGSTPLHRASEGFLKGHLGVVRLLLDYGADVHVRNISGKTASGVARGPEHQEIVQLLSHQTAE